MDLKTKKLNKIVGFISMMLWIISLLLQYVIMSDFYIDHRQVFYLSHIILIAGSLLLFIFPSKPIYTLILVSLAGFVNIAFENAFQGFIISGFGLFFILRLRKDRKERILILTASFAVSILLVISQLRFGFYNFLNTAVYTFIFICALYLIFLYNSISGRIITNASSNLSEDDEKIIDFIKEGITYKQIGLNIGKSESFVKQHVGILMQRFGVSSREDLIKFF